MQPLIFFSFSLIILFHSTVLFGKLSLIHPVPGTKIMSGEIINITWSSDNNNPVDIYYSYSDKTVLIASQVYGNIYSWKVPFLKETEITIILKSFEQQLPFLLWHQPDAHFQEVFSIAFSFDRQRLITTGRDNKVKIWDIESRSQIFEYQVIGSSLKQAVFLSSDGFIAVTDSMLIVYDILNGLTETVIASDYGTTFRNVSYSESDAYISVGTDDGNVYVFHPNGDLQFNFNSGISSVIYSVRFGRDGSKLIFSDYEGYIHIGEMETGSIKSKGTHGNNGTNAVVWSADTDDSYNRIISGSVDLTVRLWDYLSDDESARFQIHNRHVRAVRISADGRRAISGALDGKIQQYDVARREHLQRLEIDHGGSILSLDATPMMDTIASAGRDNSFKLWYNDEITYVEITADYELDNDLYIRVADKSVVAGANFTLPVYTNIAKLFADSSFHKVKYSLELDIPNLIMESLEGELVIKNGFYNRHKFLYDFYLNDEILLEFESIALYSHIDYDSVKIKDFHFFDYETPDILYYDGEIRLIYECEGDSQRKVFVGDEGNKVNVFPNPVKEIFFVDIKLIETANYEITLVDLKGNELFLIYHGHLNYGKHTFNFNSSKLETGNYFVVIKWNDKSIATKFQCRK